MEDKFLSTLYSMYLLCTYCVLGTILGARNTTVSKISIPAHDAYIPVNRIKAINKSNDKYNIRQTGDKNKGTEEEKHKQRKATERKDGEGWVGSGGVRKAPLQWVILEAQACGPKSRVPVRT